MKTNLLIKNSRPVQIKSIDGLIKHGIPLKMLTEVNEESRIYKHLVTVAVMANLAVFGLIAMYIN